MITFEQIEKLRKHAAVSYDEAKNALEMTGGDMLDAIILLEKRGKTEYRTPYQGYRQNYETTQFGYQNPNWQYQKQIPTGYREPSLWQKMTTRVKHLFRWSIRNHFIIYKDNSEIIKIPMLLFMIVALAWFLPVVPVMLIGMLFGFHYSFGQEEIGSPDSPFNQESKPNPNKYQPYNNKYGSVANNNTNWQDNPYKQNNNTHQPYVSPFKTQGQSPVQNPTENIQPKQPYVSPFKTPKQPEVSSAQDPVENSALKQQSPDFEPTTQKNQDQNINQPANYEENIDL